MRNFLGVVVTLLLFALPARAELVIEITAGSANSSSVTTTPRKFLISTSSLQV